MCLQFACQERKPTKHKFNGTMLNNIFKSAIIPEIVIIILRRSRKFEHVKDMIR